MFQCKDLCTLPSLSQAKLIAGKTGLHRGIRWAFKPENMNFSERIHGQELLAIGEPLMQSEGYDLYELVKAAIQLNVSGVLLSLGDVYVEKIEENVLKLADEKNLPLFVLSSQILLIDVFEELGHAIAYQDRVEMEKQDFLAEIIYGGRQGIERMLLEAKRLHYNMETEQRIFVIQFACDQEKFTRDEEEQKNFATEMENALKNQGVEAVISCLNQTMVGITNEKERKNLKVAFAMLAETMQHHFPNVCYQIGVGDAHEPVCHFQKGYEEAQKAIALTSNKENPYGVFWFDELGFYQVLLAVEEKDVLNRYEEQMLGALIAYDKKNHTELIRTLETYFLCDENIKATAEKIYSHPNTIKYRLKKMEKILGIEMKSSNNRFALYNALQIYRMNRSR